MADRKRINDLVQEAKRLGEEIPSGVALIGDRELTEAEIEYGKKLQPYARWCREGECWQQLVPAYRLRGGGE